MSPWCAYSIIQRFRNKYLREQRTSPVSLFRVRARAIERRRRNRSTKQRKLKWFCSSKLSWFPRVSDFAIDRSVQDQLSFFEPSLKVTCTQRRTGEAAPLADMSWCCFGGSMEKKGRDSSHNLREISGTLPRNIKLFPYKELSSATNHFHPSNKLGRGGFGTVYKGILRDGTPVAIKVLSAESRQGVREFLNEIDTVTNVKHPNLVEIIGCCAQQKDRILVYEYVENNSLDRTLLSKRNATIKMDWVKRSAICLGIARGLAFLHEEVEPPIVHRDIKASNILLDKDLIPKIGDFGLAKFFPENLTHISTRVAGTTGYLAPEYAMGGQLTKKADVYSFGVLLIEIISGRSSAKENWGGAERHVLEWVWHLHKEGRLLELVDTELVQYPEDEVVRYMKIALFCTQAAASRRPQMTQVVEMLSRDVRLNEKELTVPGFFQDSTKNSSDSASSSNKNLVSDTSSEPVSYFPSAITHVHAR